MITSRDLAKMFNRAHKDVLTHIKSYIKIHNNLQGLSEGNYVSGRGKRYKQYELYGEAEQVFISRLTGFSRVPTGYAERVALDTIEQLKGIKLLRQYKVLTYRVDGYDPISKIAYEIDEPAHIYKKQKDAERQHAIQKELGCTFVRIKVS